MQNSSLDMKKAGPDQTAGSRLMECPEAWRVGHAGWERDGNPPTSGARFGKSVARTRIGAPAEMDRGHIRPERRPHVLSPEGPRR